MNHIFLPLVLCPIFLANAPEEPIGHILYTPVEIRAPNHPEYIFITPDYQPYTHHYYPDDGSDYGENEPIEWSS